jgi:hypothetical protein
MYAPPPDGRVELRRNPVRACLDDAAPRPGERGAKAGGLVDLRWTDPDLERGFVLIEDPKASPHQVITPSEVAVDHGFLLRYPPQAERTNS